MQNESIIKIKKYNTSFFNDDVFVRRINKIVYIDVNTTSAIYCNPLIKHTLFTLDDVFLTIDSLCVIPINNSGITAFIAIESGRLIMTTNKSIDIDDAVCIHVVFTIG